MSRLEASSSASAKFALSNKWVCPPQKVTNSQKGRHRRIQAKFKVIRRASVFWILSGGGLLVKAFCLVEVNKYNCNSAIKRPSRVRSGLLVKSPAVLHHLFVAASTKPSQWCNWCDCKGWDFSVLFLWAGCEKLAKFSHTAGYFCASV